MTYIVFFDDVASENMAACLTCMPERIIFIGDSAKQMQEHIENYKKVVTARGYDIEFLYRTVSRHNLDATLELLDLIINSYDNCVFDITGGEGIPMLALGMIYQKYPDAKIQIQKLNVRNSSAYDYDKDGIIAYSEPPKLSIDENIRIFGGDVVYGGAEDDSKTYKWDLNDEFLNDLNLMWDICKTHKRNWNKQLGIFASAELVGNISEDWITTTVIKSEFEDYLIKQGSKYKKHQDIIDELLKYNLISDFTDDGEIWSLTYKNKQVKRCLIRAGQMLEMVVYLAALKATDKNGEAVYNDVLNGVVIDWDGELHDEEKEKIFDIENEIDVMFMHGLVPVFVSCKNGHFNADELYKLNTVAERFGGCYAKKVLVTTTLKKSRKADSYIYQRADEMGIRIVDDVQFIEKKELLRIVRSFWSN